MLLTVVDDDEAGILLAEASSTAVAMEEIEAGLTEGGTNALLVRLNSPPLAEISVGLSLVVETIGVSYEPVSLTLSGGSIQTLGDEQYLLFDASNWNIDQTLELSVLDDLDAYGGTALLLLSIAPSSTPSFAEAMATATLVVADDELVAFVLAATETNTTTTALAVSANLVILEGATDEFIVRLSAQPFADVTVDVVVLATDGVSAGVDVAQLNFTRDNWHDAQTVIIEALADNDIVDGQLTITLQVADASSLIFGVTGDSFELWLEDDDEAGLTVAHLGVTTVYEEGNITGAASTRISLFTVALVSEPLEDVVIALSSEILDGVASRRFWTGVFVITDLTFNSSNWDVAQDVFFEALADDDTRDGVVSVIFSVTDATSASWGSGLVSASSSYRVEVQDDDAATIGILASTTTLVEGGASGTLLVRLNANPIDNISLTITTAHDTSASVTLSDLTLAATSVIYFDASNWATGVTLVALASDDADVSDGVVTVSIEVSDSSTANYSNARYGYVQASETVLLTVVDDDEAGILLAEASSTAVAMEEIEAGLTEGGTNALLVRLNAPPSAEVSVVLSLSVETIGLGYEPVSLTLSGDSVQTTAASEQYLLFDSDNWDINQTLDVAVLEDLDAYGGTALLLLSIAPSSTPSFAEAMATATLVVADDELAAFVLAATETNTTTTALAVSANLVILEGVTDEFIVRLSAQPFADVTVDVVVLATNGVSSRVDVAQLNFTRDNWQDVQTITIEALADDDIVDGQITLRLSVAVASSPVYAAVAEEFALWLEDDDEAGLTVAHLGVTTVYEEGNAIGSASTRISLLTVALISEPLEDVVIALSSEILDGVASRRFTVGAGVVVTNLTFSSINWDVAQDVFFEALADDDTRDGVVSVIFSVTDATSASWGSGLVSASQSHRLTVQDDDAATIAIIASTTTLVEGGASATLLVRLNANPIDNISLTITTARDTSASVTLSDLTLAATSVIYFDASNWATGVTLVALASDDADVSDGVVTVSIEVSDSSTANYSNARYGYVQASETMLLTVVDDDEAGILLAEASSTAVAMEEIEAGLTEGGTNALLVRLNAPPSAEVSVVLSLSVETIGLDYEPVSLTLSGDSVQTTAASEQYLLFDASNWNIGQTLELSVLDDLDAYGGTALLLLSIAPSSTPSFAEAMATATLVVADDELAAFVLAATETNTTTTVLAVSANLVILEGATDEFIVRLSAQPFADVTVDVVVLATNGVSSRVDVAQLNFTRDNWQDVQTITIEALADDDIVDGQITLRLSVAVASSPVYAAVAEEFALWIEDDDEAGLTVAHLGVTTVYEEGNAIGSASTRISLLTVALISEPLEDVVIALSSEIIDGVASRRFTVGAGVVVTNLTFSSINWDAAQDVFFEALADDDTRDGVVSVIFSVSDASSASWGGDLVSASQSHRLTVQDDDAATIAIIASAMSLIEGVASGGLAPSATFFVRLSANPIDAISLEVLLSADISASAVAQTLSGAATNILYFDASNWQDGQTLIISSVSDLDIVDGVVSVLIQVSDASTVAYSNVRYGYDRATAGFVIEVLDDDTANIVVRAGGAVDYAPYASAIRLTEGRTLDLLVRLNAAAAGRC